MIKYIKATNPLVELEKILDISKNVVYFSSNIFDFSLNIAPKSHLGYSTNITNETLLELDKHKHAIFLHRDNTYEYFVYDFTKDDKIPNRLLTNLEHFAFLTDERAPRKIILLINPSINVPNEMPNSLVEIDTSKLDMVHKEEHTYFDALPKLLSDEAKAFGIKAPKACLMVGFPGTGKTLSAEYCATKLGRPLYQLNISNVYNKYVGESEKALSAALDYVSNIKSVLFIDEMDKLFINDDNNAVQQKITAQLLTWLSEKHDDCYVFMAANRVKKIPIEMLRKGRVDNIIHVKLPDLTTRQELLDKHGTYCLHSAEELEGYSHAEIVWLCDRYRQEAFLSVNDGGVVNKIVYTPMSVKLPHQLEEITTWADIYAG